MLLQEGSGNVLLQWSQGYTSTREEQEQQHAILHVLGVHACSGTVLSFRFATNYSKCDRSPFVTRLPRMSCQRRLASCCVLRPCFLWGLIKPGASNQGRGAAALAAGRRFLSCCKRVSDSWVVAGSCLACKGESSPGFPGCGAWCSQYRSSSEGHSLVFSCCVMIACCTDSGRSRLLQSRNLRRLA